MFAAPKLIEAQPIEMLSQPEIALKLQSRVFADRVMRCQECAEPDTRHQEFPVVPNPAFFSQIAIDGNAQAMAPENSIAGLK